MKTEKIPVVYISGRGRSGSTLLENLLGKNHQAFTIGEFRLWHKSYSSESYCSCGKPNIDCPFWRKIFSDLDSETEKRYREEFNNIMNHRNQLKFSKEAITPELKEAITFLYTKIYQESGQKLIIDSSKNPFYGFILSNIDIIDLKILHLVRDPRAVSYSWKRQEQKIDRDDHALYQQKLGIFKGAVLWTGSNILTEILKLKAKGQKYKLKYEDLTSSPDKALADLALAINLPSKAQDLNNENVENDVHAISGNPTRLKKGGFSKIKRDDAWKEKLSWPAFMLTTILTFPLLLFYRYRIKR